jgi:hypothetical protein
MKVELVNPEEKEIWKHSFIVSIGSVGTSHFLVHAYSEQDAIDEVADFADRKGYKGFFAEYIEPENVPAYFDETHPEHSHMQDAYFPAGNASMLLTSEISIKQLR